MSKGALFLAGTAFGILLMQPSAAQQAKVSSMRLHHVGMNVKNPRESAEFFTKTMGFRQAFSTTDKLGVTRTFVQISRETFLELAPASAGNPVGITHAGIWVDDMAATLAALRKNGAKVDEPVVGESKSPRTNVFDPSGIRLELQEFPPESRQRQAIEAWK
jgi:catechol 2,3-dioxygenase-like lactoylglutathione lyase family enzyme